jgi:hypothetical protein
MGDLLVRGELLRYGLKAPLWNRWRNVVRYARARDSVLVRIFSRHFEKKGE